MSSIKLYLETIVHLMPMQLAYQIINKVYHPSLKHYTAPRPYAQLHIEPPIPKQSCYDGQNFCSLNIKDRFTSWNRTDHGMLWGYNLNYMDWLQQEGLSEDECEKWVDRFMEELPQNYVGQDPYPTALRAINWIKSFSMRPSLRTNQRDDSLYSQILLLKRRKEHHLQGNHLLEDAYALFVSGLYFNDNNLFADAWGVLKKQLGIQILADGAHYEQSPMYHCILLDRLLDCYNFSVNNALFDQQSVANDYLKGKAEVMLGHLESIIWENGSIPLLNDSAYGIAPTSEQLFDYAKRLGLTWKPIPLKECGYRKMKSNRLEAVVDVGNITAEYQPGHTHADTFNYVLRVDGKPFIVDTGISTYNKTTRRQYERSTAAHNTVAIGNRDSSRVWGGFRVGKRAKVTVVKDTPDEIVATHDGYKKVSDCKRKFRSNKYGLTIEDTVSDGVHAVSYLHFAPGVEPYYSDDDYNNVTTDELLIELDGCEKIETIDDFASTEYNKLEPIKVLALHFVGKLSYTFIDVK